VLPIQRTRWYPLKVGAGRAVTEKTVGVYAVNVRDAPVAVAGWLRVMFVEPDTAVTVVFAAMFGPEIGEPTFRPEFDETVMPVEPLVVEPPVSVSVAELWVIDWLSVMVLPDAAVTTVPEAMPVPVRSVLTDGSVLPEAKIMVLLGAVLEYIVYPLNVAGVAEPPPTVSFVA
jgi:hypothetical protein